jgi:hypothetical protein
MRAATLIPNERVYTDYQIFSVTHHLKVGIFYRHFLDT